MRFSNREYDHLHEHLRSLDERFDDVERHLRELARLEIVTSLKEMSAMAKQSEEINKLSDKFDTLGGVVTDIHSDFEALRAVMEADRENLSDAGLAALEAANAKADSLRERLAALDVAVGDADGSDIPTEPAPGDPGEVPAEEPAPPAGEGTVVNPDEQFPFGEGGARPTA